MYIICFTIYYLYRDHDKFYTYGPMTNLTLGILGVGDIGSEIARAAKFFGMNVLGFVKQQRTDRSQHVDKYM